MAHLAKAYGLGEVVVHASQEAAVAGLGASIGSHCDNVGLGAVSEFLTDQAGASVAIHFGHVKIEKDDIGLS